MQLALAAPATCAGIEYQQRRLGGQHEVPLLKAQQLFDQAILRSAVEIAAVIGAVAQGLAALQQLAKHVRVVAPALAEHVADQRVADDAPREGVPVGGFFPLGREVPVVRDVVGVSVGSLRSMDSNWKLENAAFPSKSQLVHMD